MLAVARVKVYPSILLIVPFTQQYYDVRLCGVSMHILKQKKNDVIK